MQMLVLILIKVAKVWFKMRSRVFIY
jgi:hypothetical protein